MSQPGAGSEEFTIEASKRVSSAHEYSSEVGNETVGSQPHQLSDSNQSGVCLPVWGQHTVNFSHLSCQTAQKSPVYPLRGNQDPVPKAAVLSLDDSSIISASSACPD